MLGRLVDEAIRERGFAYPWGNVLPVLQQLDLFFVNLECALTAETTRWYDGEYKPFHFRADPAVVETLKVGRVDVASLANNHIGDFGEAGLLETLRVLDAAGIAHAGAGVDLAAASEPVRVTSHGVRISVVAFADYPAAWAATPTTPGFNYTHVSVDDEHFGYVARCIESARRDADLVVFSIHWGPNMRARPTDNFRRFARRVIEAGADVFWGHSAHVVQGLEVYRGKPILYDTGDFVDDYAVHEDLRNDLSALFVLRIAPPAVERVDLVLVQIAKMQVNLATGPARTWLARRLTRLCAEMGTTLSEVPAGLGVSIPAAPPGSELIRERCRP